MEGLLENTHELKGKMKEKVIANAELGLLSKKLATIMLDCNVTFDAESYLLSAPDAEKVTKLFEELEFRRMKDQFFKLFDADGLKETTETVKPSQVKTKSTAGAGQFSLFDAGGDAPDASAAFSSRNTIANTSHHYLSLIHI